MTVLVTGAAGFIGFHVSRQLLERGETVIGVDNFNSYYDVELKTQRAEILESDERFTLLAEDISDPKFLYDSSRFKSILRIVHLAAQAGVRYSLSNPSQYVDSNLVGHSHVLELARGLGVENMVYASSSSVYGGNNKVPFSEDDPTDHPVSFYAATKKSKEVLSESYAHLYGIPLTGLRFFTVYGPWGRPDMAYWLFSKAALEGKPINVFNHGQMSRDFTHIADIVSGVLSALDRPSSELGLPSPHRIYNLGNDKPQSLMNMIKAIEGAFDCSLEKNFMPHQSGDVKRTWADIKRARSELSYNPRVSLEDGIDDFAEWFRAYSVSEDV